MKKIILSLVAMSSLGFAEGALIPVVEDEIDEKGLYVGAGISAMSVRDTSVAMNIFAVTGGQDRLCNAALLAGYAINDYLSLEGRYAFSVSGEDVIKMNNQWGLFVKPMYKFENDEDRREGNNYFAVYTLLGYGGIEINGTNHTLTHVDGTGFQWGLGFSYTFRETSHEGNYKYKDNWSVYAEYVNVGNAMDGLNFTGATEVDTDAFTVGVMYKF